MVKLTFSPGRTGSTDAGGVLHPIGGQRYRNRHVHMIRIPSIEFPRVAGAKVGHRPQGGVSLSGCAGVLAFGEGDLHRPHQPGRRHNIKASHHARDQVDSPVILHGGLFHLFIEHPDR